MTSTQRLLSFNTQSIIKEGISSKRLNPFIRYQAYVRVEDFFQSEAGFCLCGCAQKLPTKRHKWATPDCGTFANAVLNIIRGHRETVLFYLTELHGAACVHCGITDTELEVDHIKPVVYGGGACWLDNFQLLCYDCHQIKSKHDLKK